MEALAWALERMPTALEPEYESALAILESPHDVAWKSAGLERTPRMLAARLQSVALRWVCQSQEPKVAARAKAWTQVARCAVTTTSAWQRVRMLVAAGGHQHCAAMVPKTLHRLVTVPVERSHWLAITLSSTELRAV